VVTNVTVPPAATVVDDRAVARSAGTRRVGVVMAVCGVVGGLAAAVLLIEKIRSLQDPTYIPSCSLSPILSCGSVMASDQAEAFGFPNPIIGVAGFSVVASVGVVVTSGAVLVRWVWIGMQVGVVCGVGFVHWLAFQGLYRLDTLCPYCLVVWVVTIAVFVYVTRFNVLAGHLGLRGRWEQAATGVFDLHGVVLTTWYLVFVALIGQRFWWYWSDVLR